MRKNKPSLIIMLIAFSLLFYKCNKKEHINSKYNDVLNFYSHYDSDSLKLKAAYFLLENMQEFDSYNTKSSPFYKKFFSGMKILNDSLESLSESDRDFIIQNSYNGKIDSIWESIKKSSEVGPFSIKKEFDIEAVTSNELIENIELAFDVWESPWARDLSFEEFCEFVLPYKGFDEPFENWRQEYMEKYLWIIDSMKGSTDRVKASDLINNELKSWFKFDTFFMNRYPGSQSPQQILLSKTGKCSDQVNLALYAMRSVGIPVSKDYTPLYGDNKTGHSWNSLLLKNGKTINFQGASNGIGTQSFPFKLSKVYRKTFIKNKKSLAARVSDSKKIPPFLRGSHFIDVSADYNEVFTSKSVQLNIESVIPKERYAYLCTFNNEKWEAITWSEIKEGKVHFENMGIDIVYLLSYYVDGDYVPANAPFIIEKDGSLRYLKPFKDTHNLKLERKYPHRWMMKWRASTLKKGQFQGANKSDFSDAENLYQISDDEIVKPHYVIQPVTNKKKFRFVRFLLHNRTEIAEISFYSNNSNSKRKYILNGEIITSTKADKNFISKIFDQRNDNYFSYPKGDNVWYGLDFKEAQTISQVGYCPRNDSNNVEPNDLYELFYWNNGWISLGRKTAESYNLNYENAPKNSLFWLRNLTEGKEERIFTYEDNKQVWW